MLSVLDLPPRPTNQRAHEADLKFWLAGRRNIAGEVPTGGRYGDPRARGSPLLRAVLFFIMSTGLGGQI